MTSFAGLQKGEKMRMIDADALIIDLMDRGIEGIQTDDWNEIQDTVLVQPTIEPDEYKEIDFVQPHKKLSVILHPERKKGKWIDDGTEFGCCCSECGETLDDYFDGVLCEIYLNKMPNFCPNCGCQMGRNKNG